MPERLVAVGRVLHTAKPMTAGQMHSVGAGRPPPLSPAHRAGDENARLRASLGLVEPAVASLDDRHCGSVAPHRAATQSRRQPGGFLWAGNHSFTMKQVWCAGTALRKWPLGAKPRSPKNTPTARPGCSSRTK